MRARARQPITEEISPDAFQRSAQRGTISSVSEENPDAVCLHESALDSAGVPHFTPSHLRGDWLGVIYSRTVRLFYVLSLWRDVWAWHM